MVARIGKIRESLMGNSPAAHARICMADAPLLSESSYGGDYEREMDEERGKTDGGRDERPPG